MHFYKKLEKQATMIINYYTFPDYLFIYTFYTHTFFLKENAFAFNTSDKMLLNYFGNPHLNDSQI